MFGRSWLLLMVCVLVGCGNRAAPRVLPATGAYAEDRLVIVMHGYISSGEEIESLVDGLVEGDRPYHVHNFDFGAFTRVGHSHNAGVEELGEALLAFYTDLPQRCPVCAERADAPVEVTVVARSFGGLVTREALLAGAADARPPWQIARVVSLSTPFFGSVMTRYSTGFLSIVINGFVRTVLFGFVNPERGGNFGRVIDEQIRALRLGSPYLWRTHMRWQAHLASGAPAPRWLTVLALGSGRPEVRGDGVMRFASGNIAPLLPAAQIEAVLIDVLHNQLFNRPVRGHAADERALMLRAIRRFVEDGTLAREPALAPHAIVRGADGALALTRDPPPGAKMLQTVYLQPGGPGREEKVADVERILAHDAGDLWVRFYAGAPDGAPQEIVLSRHLSAFQQGPEWAWQELDPHFEPSADGAEIPTTMSVGPTHSHLVHIPDVAPAGDWALRVTLTGGLTVPAEWITVTAEGVGAQPRGTGDWAPVHIAPLQANLVRVYLDEDAIRAAHPGLGILEIRAVSLEPRP